MNKTIEEIAHSAALELSHRCGVDSKDVDMAEVIMRQAIRDGILRSRALDVSYVAKRLSKNPNRFYVSE